MDIKSSTLEVIEKVREAFRAAKLEAPTDGAIASINGAEATLSKIEEQIGAVVDASSKTAADKANKIFALLEAAAMPIVTGNYSSGEVTKALGSALAEATGWVSIKPSKWVRDAKESEVKTSADLSKTVTKKSRVFGAKNSITDALSLIESKMQSGKGQNAKIDELKEKRKAERARKQELEDQKDEVIADYQAGMLDDVEAQEKILEIQDGVNRIEERIETINARIAQYGGVAAANADKLEELYNIIDNANFYADNPEVTVAIADAIDFSALTAFITGVSADVVIERIVKIDTVSNIIAKQMKISAEEAKRKLSQQRVMVGGGNKNKTAELEESIKKQQERKQNAKAFMQDLIAGGSGKPKPKVEIPTGGNGEIKISAGIEDL